jgi:CheY-like chemotaxis protein/HPt (histidine-containing phosphotransfer) domain-containing protein
VADTVLQQYGATITEAVNGADAVAALRTNQFDIILMDIQMPVMDGLEATRIIRHEIRSNIPIIALTANAVKGEMEKCIQAGMNDYLSKPFEEEELVQLIAKWLGREVCFEVPKETPKTNAPLYDLNKLRQISRGNERMVLKLLQLFINEAGKSLQEITCAFEIKDIDKVKFIIHRIKSPLGNLCVETATSIADQIEKTEWTGNDYPSLAALINEFKHLVEEVVEQVKGECLQFTS